MDATSVWAEMRSVWPFVVAAALLGAAVAAALDPATRHAWLGRLLRRPSSGDRVAGSRLQLSPGRAVGVAAAAATVIVVPLALTTGGLDASSHRLALGPVQRAGVMTPVDDGLRLDAVKAAPSQGDAAAGELLDAAWLFGALVSGGRTAQAYALLTDEAKQQMTLSLFESRLAEAQLLRGSSDVPWRVPGSNTFLFTLSDRAPEGTVEGEARVSFERVDGQWRASSLRFSEAAPRRATGASR